MTVRNKTISTINNIVFSILKKLYKINPFRVKKIGNYKAIFKPFQKIDKEASQFQIKLIIMKMLNNIWNKISSKFMNIITIVYWNRNKIVCKIKIK